LPEAGLLGAGRSCPSHYGYLPRGFARDAEFVAETIYVIGGLYGNAFALDAIEQLAAQEPTAPQLIFNGDFHWFDATEDAFVEIQQHIVGVAGRHALRGNVETEIASDDASAGCGCAYPESVSDAEVERSNAILARLRGAAQRADPALAQRLAQLPMHLVVQVGAARIAIVHGDAWSLAGWRFAHDALHDPANIPLLHACFQQAAVDVFACSHTCAPALRTLGHRAIVNNGAAGMANFTGTTGGLITRISTRSLPTSIAPEGRYGTETAGVHIDALQVNFDVSAWLRRFDAIWAANSPAAVSYRPRIVDGPRFTVAMALGGTVAQPNCAIAS